MNHAVNRPKLNYSTVLRLWNLSFAQTTIDTLEISHPDGLKPNHIHVSFRPDTTEPEKYTLTLLRLICDVSFGATNAKDFPIQKKIWNANAAWVRHNVPIGKGLSFQELSDLACLYTEHVRLDTSLSTTGVC